jgi:hypothetical protein
MYKLSNWLTIFLAALLPWHGAITVFLPEPFRWWKEVVLILFIGLVLWSEWRAAQRKKTFSFSLAEFFALGFLLWGFVLILLSADIPTATISMRYLGLLFLTFFIWSIWFQNPKNKQSEYLTLFAQIFIPSCLLATAFGFWITNLGGSDFVQNFYSTTISSWVPGQTIPLWHEINSIARLQGASSGPIEFSHLLVAALALVPLLKQSTIQTTLLTAVFCIGIYLSASRSALLGAIIILGWWGWNAIPKTISRKKIALTAILLGILGFLFIGTQTQILQRAGTSDHFTRPIEAFSEGTKNILLGHLGEWGPAARGKNLVEYNNDQSPLAENVFADWWVQLGILGLAFGLGWFIIVLIGMGKPGLGFGIATILLINFATVFDMTPIALAWGTILALWQKGK